MNVLLTGGSSSVARALVPLLAASGRVATAGRVGCDIRLDLLDPQEAFAFPPGLDAVVHAAADFGGEAPEDMLRALEANVLGTLKVCEAARRAGAGHVLLLSTIYAALDAGDRNFGVYALSKRQAEEAAALFCARHGLSLCVLRPAPLYGDPAALRRHQPLLRHWAEQARSGGDLRVYGSRDALRNYLHLDDLARVIRRALELRLTGVYPCCHPRDVRLSEIAAAMVAAFGSQSRVGFAPEHPDQPDNIFPADGRLYEALGLAPALSLEEGLRRLARAMEAGA